MQAPYTQRKGKPPFRRYLPLPLRRCLHSLLHLHSCKHPSLEFVQLMLVPPEPKGRSRFSQIFTQLHEAAYQVSKTKRLHERILIGTHHEHETLTGTRMSSSVLRGLQELHRLGHGATLVPRSFISGVQRVAVVSSSIADKRKLDSCLWADRYRRLCHSSSLCAQSPPCCSQSCL